MRISLNWLKKFVDIKISDEGLVRLIGARLVEVEDVIDETHKYDKIYVVKVVEAEKIPDTHLTRCMIDCGEKELVQVMCGAPNVHEGMLAAWIAPGAVVPASVHEDAPFVIGTRKMLGKYDSHGMLAAADELDIGEDHEGIIEIDPEMAKPGDLLADVFGLNDKILDIENKSLTHRPDCFGMIGFAREVAGILGQRFEMDFSRDFGGCCRDGAPEPREDGREGRDPRKVPFKLLPDIKISDNTICPRLTAVVMEKHGEIKKKYLTYIDTVLAKSGMKPISPIVDATNYLMLLTGQPLHAYDYDKFVKVGKTDKPIIGVRLAKKNEKLTLLDDTDLVLNENDIIITSNDVPVGLAGAKGGKSTMIDENTKNILLEVATFSLFNLRKTQMAHGVFTEAITRYTKGQPPYQTLAVAEKCAEMLAEGFKVAGVADKYPKPEKPSVVKITTNEINGLLGTDYSTELITKTLENVGFQITSVSDRSEVTTEKEGASPVTTGRSDPCPKQIVIEILVPEWRTDIHIKEDIIEEVGRLLGYDNIKPVLPAHYTAERNKMFEMKRQIRDLMARYGASELLTYSFVSEQLLEKAGLDVKNSYRIVNSISPELQLVRQSIVPSLLDKSFMNQKLPVDKFAIYEMNTVYRKDLGLTDEKVPTEKVSLGFVVAERKNQETAYYKAKKYAAKLFEELNIVVEFVPLKSNKLAEAKPFEVKRSAEILVDGKYIGVVGEFKNSVRSAFKLAPYLAGFEVDMETLVTQMSHKKQINLKEQKPEDLTLTTDKSYAAALAEVQKKYPEAKIKPGTIYQAEGQKTRNITFHIEK
ncbi:phenylalanine--tRNA ligase subunit beta [Candidatus Saccharibacteria bacterium]|nr:phenylalanine--tRNA ligase subunit beta [Candidatus Saccharibacteria bacterium]